LRIDDETACHQLFAIHDSSGPLRRAKRA
jgi:hypothetical protein